MSPTSRATPPRPPTACLPRPGRRWSLRCGASLSHYGARVDRPRGRLGGASPRPRHPAAIAAFEPQQDLLG
eukprot:11974948-Alexandrium_andersonii.AAC.1